MMSAIVAAREGCDVTLYEHKDRVGKKILTTGNGKCNLTNLSISKDDYRGNHPSFVMPILESFSVSDTLKFFEELGLFYKEKNGYVYPVSNQASTVLDLLRTELARCRVKVCTECGNLEIKALNGAKKEGFAVKNPKGSRNFDRVILATGSKAAPVTGSDGSGYKLARGFGHSIVKVLPALVQLKGDEAFFKPVAGVRMDVKLSLFIEKQLCMEEEGELQLTNYGLSGIPIFQFSRFAVKAMDDKKKVHILCDFLPGVEQKELYENLKNRCKKTSLTIEEALNGVLNKKLNLLMMKHLGLKPTANVAELTEKQLKGMCAFIKECYIPVYGYQSFENAQVCQGGVNTEELTNSLESKLQKGLFFAGEMIDVDGICGGYNLQWAWSSGFVAGREAGR